MPARERSLNYEHNQEMRAYADKLNLANQKADSLQKEADQYRQEKEAAEENLSSLMGDSDSTLSQYGTMVQILNAWRKGDIAERQCSFISAWTRVRSPMRAWPASWESSRQK